jgi:hypothetical protein
MKQIYKENNYYLLNHSIVERLKLGSILKIRYLSIDFIIVQYLPNKILKKI